MASIGHEVIAYDVDLEKISRLKNGELPFFEPELSKMLNSTIASGKLKFTSSLEEAVSNSEIHFLCVGTPQLEGNGAADLTQINNAINSMAEFLKPGSIVVGKSTVPVGTAAKLQELLERKFGDGVSLVWNPEFLREGFAVKDTLNPDRIVLGSPKTESAKTVLEVYSPITRQNTPVVITDFATAELVKVAANAFLATKISFINAFADLCDAVGADVSTLADAIGYDERIGRKFLNAGIGFGGGCLPKDIRALQARADELGLSEQFNFLAEVDRVNQGRRIKIEKLAAKKLKGLINKKITILGGSFKPNSDDVRDSPALSIAQELQNQGAIITIHDPIAVLALNKKDPTISATTSIEDALVGAELVLHLTEWEIYRNLDPVTLGKLVSQKFIIDGRNVLDRQTWENAGWQITYLGKPGS